MCNEPWITNVGNLSVKVTDPMPQNVNDESSWAIISDVLTQRGLNRLAN